MKIRRIPAFTLVEIVIVLLLSMMVVGIVLVGYSHFEKYRANQSKQSQRLEEMLMAHTGLLNCFEQAKEIKVEDKKLIFIDSIVFAQCEFFDGGIVLNKGNRVDSLNLKINNLKMTMGKSHPYLEGLYFDLVPEEMKLQFQFRKEYGSAIKFNAEIIDR